MKMPKEIIKSMASPKAGVPMIGIGTTIPGLENRVDSGVSAKHRGEEGSAGARQPDEPNDMMWLPLPPQPHLACTRSMAGTGGNAVNDGCRHCGRVVCASRLSNETRPNGRRNLPKTQGP